MQAIECIVDLHKNKSAETMKKFLWSSVVLIIVAALVWQNVKGQKPITVDYRVAALGTVESTVANTRSGTIKACQRSRLSASSGGQIAALHVKEGDHVKQGQVLIELWNLDRKALLAQAKAALVKHRLDIQSVCTSSNSDNREAERLERLSKTQQISQDRVDIASSQAKSNQLRCQAAKAQAQQYQSQIDLHRAQLAQTLLKAPFDGIVAEVTGEIGEYTTPSPPGVQTPPAIDLLTDDCHYLSAPIDEVDAAHIATGLPAKVTLDAFRGETFSGKVTRIAPYVEDKAKQARTVEIEVAFDTEHKLLAGYSADVQVVLDKKTDVLRIPTEAIMEDGVVWVVEDDIVVEKNIKIGIGNWQHSQVVEGLQAGDKVIVSLGAQQLKPGVKVKLND